MVLLVLPEIKCEMKVLTTIANKEAFTPFVIGVSDSNKPKVSTSNHTEISSKISIGCDFY